MNQLPLIERAIGYAERNAVRSANGTTTYGQLVAGSEAIATSLLAKTDDLNEARIAFLVPAEASYIQTQWGIWRAGGIAVPFSLSATGKELEYTLTDSQATTVIVANELSGNVRSLCKQDSIRLLSGDDLPAASHVELPEITSDRQAMILYTSGTTSKPKGGVTTHACIQAQIESLNEAWHWQQDDRIPLFLPLHHIHGIINIMLCALWSGAALETFPRFDLKAILNRVTDQAYSIFMAVPTIYVNLIEALDAMPCGQRQAIVRGFAEMRLMVSGSAALPASVNEKWTELTGQRLLERYGMTEIGMALSNPYEAERRPDAVGQP